MGSVVPAGTPLGVKFHVIHQLGQTEIRTPWPAGGWWTVNSYISAYVGSSSQCNHGSSAPNILPVSPAAAVAAVAPPHIRHCHHLRCSEKLLRSGQRLPNIWPDTMYWAQSGHLSDRPGPVLHHPGQMCPQGQHHLQAEGAAGDGRPIPV